MAPRSLDKLPPPPADLSRRPLPLRGIQGVIYRIHRPDGIIYRSRHNPRFLCLALFDRCQASMTVEISEALMAGSRRAWTIGQIAKYNLAVEPIV